jgi:hypothetical protein
MIIGAHSIIYSRKPFGDKNFPRSAGAPKPLAIIRDIQYI